MSPLHGEADLRIVLRAVLRGVPETRGAVWRDRRRLEGVALLAQGGDREARDALWSIVRSPLERIALAMGIAPIDIPDLVQETLMAAHVNLDRFDPDRGSMRTWLATIMARLRLNLLRRRARRVRLLERLAGGISREVARGGRVKRGAPSAGDDVGEVLDRLTNRQRQVVIVYAIAGLSALEAGRALGITAAGVRSIARDARNRLGRPGVPLLNGRPPACRSRHR
jgi:RNA polymerase sigma-70 factor (ECF subfamily)